MTKIEKLTTYNTKLERLTWQLAAVLSLAEAKAVREDIQRLIAATDRRRGAPHVTARQQARRLRHETETLIGEILLWLLQTGQRHSGYFSTDRGKKQLPTLADLGLHQWMPDKWVVKARALPEPSFAMQLIAASDRAEVDRLSARANSFLHKRRERRDRKARDLALVQRLACRRRMGQLIRDGKITMRSAVASELAALSWPEFARKIEAMLKDAEEKMPMEVLAAPLKMVQTPFVEGHRRVWAEPIEEAEEPASKVASGKSS